MRLQEASLCVWGQVTNCVFRGWSNNNSTCNQMIVFIHVMSSLTPHAEVDDRIIRLLLLMVDFICMQFTFCLEGRKEMFYLMTHSTHFIYGYMASDIW